MPVEFFPALSAIPGLVHGFVTRIPGVAVDVDRAEALARLKPEHDRILTRDLGIDPASLWLAEQVHGDRVSVCPPTEGVERLQPGSDGLATATPGEFLGIYVADCCAVWLVDPVRRACALVHSGKNGSALGIAPRAVGLMAERFGSRAADLTVQLSPCIRPPAYEIDFAARIREDCAAAGVPADRIHDPGVCTSRDLDRYYSYRAELGKTGRMLAVAGWKA